MHTYTNNNNEGKISCKFEREQEEIYKSIWKNDRIALKSKKKKMELAQTLINANPGKGGLLFT